MTERHPGGAPKRPPSTYDQDVSLIAERLSTVRHKVAVISGKGGVGKSTASVNLAAATSRFGKRVGILDVDMHGPTVHIMLGLSGQRVVVSDGRIRPAEKYGMKVMSLAFFMREADEAAIWRGPMKMNVIRQLLRDTDWGELDYLFIDCPPGTGDEPLSIAQLIPDACAVIVTTPQPVAVSAVRKSISFARALSMPVAGVIENMSGFVCPHCGKRTELFGSGGGENMAAEAGVPFLTAVPLSPEVVPSGDSGTPVIFGDDSPAGQALRSAAEKLHQILHPGE